jgi:predicted nucleic acid-binding protein
LSLDIIAQTVIPVSGHFPFAINPPLTVFEITGSIIQKFPLYRTQLDLLGASIRKDADMVALGNHTIKASCDPKDDMFIETAVWGRCQYLISGDKDLLILVSYDAMEILKPGYFLSKIGL